MKIISVFLQDAAVLTATEDAAELPLGGIDFDAKNLDLQIKRDGSGVPLPLNLQPLESMNIEGFVPIIIEIRPATNMPLLLGLAEEGSDDKTTNDSEGGETVPAAYFEQKRKARELELSSLN